MQMSTTHSCFDQYCISHKTIGHRAAAVPGPEIHCECPMEFLSVTTQRNEHFKFHKVVYRHYSGKMENVYIILQQIYSENGAPNLSESSSVIGDITKTFWSLFLDTMYVC